MKKLHYYLIDVFTDEQFGGNQLAVFPNGKEVPEQLMQKIARELNFSETTFVLPPANPKTDFKLRIFTPSSEIPMAGHPTIGSAYALLKNNLISVDKKSIVVEEGVGDIPVTFQKLGDKVIVTMQQPLPVFGPQFDQALLAEILSLDKEAILNEYPAQVVSCGVPFLYIPIKDVKSIQKIKLRLDLYEQYLSGFATNSLFVFTTDTGKPGSTVHSRMFAPGFGIPEDPATGGASGPLGAYLVKYGIAKANKTIISEQGFEMGRPSSIYIDIATENSIITQVRVGGESVLSGEGSIFLV